VAEQGGPPNIELSALQESFTFVMLRGAQGIGMQVGSVPLKRPEARQLKEEEAPVPHKPS
jgi:hypothetical protein